MHRVVIGCYLLGGAVEGSSGFEVAVCFEDLFEVEKCIHPRDILIFSIIFSLTIFGEINIVGIVKINLSRIELYRNKRKGYYKLKRVYSTHNFKQFSFFFFLLSVSQSNETFGFGFWPNVGIEAYLSVCT